MVEHAIRRFSVSDVTFKPTYIRRPSTLRENLTSREVTVWTTVTASSNLSQGLRVRIPAAQGNQIHIITPWTLGIQKIYMVTLGYKVQISL